MRGACKLRCKRKCLAVPCSRARWRCLKRDSNKTFRLLRVSLGVVFSFVSKMMSAAGFYLQSGRVPLLALPASDVSKANCCVWFRHTLKLFLAAPPFPRSLAAFASPTGTPCAERGFAALVCFGFGVWCWWLQVAACGGVVTLSPSSRHSSALFNAQVVSVWPLSCLWNCWFLTHRSKWDGI